MSQVFNTEDLEKVKRVTVNFEVAQESMVKGMAKSKELADSSNVPNLMKSGEETEEVVNDFAKNVFQDTIDSLVKLAKYFDGMNQGFGIQ